MRISTLLICIFVASNAFAQDATLQPAPAAQTTYPSAPVVPSVIMAPAGATSAPAVPASTTLDSSAGTAAPAPAAKSIDLNSMLGKLAAKPDSQQKLGQIMVIGSIMGCTQKTAGKAATDAFYQEMQGVGKTIQGYCKQGNPTLARSTALATITAKQNDPVVKSMLTCYDAQKANVAALGGQQIATDAEHYSRWLKNPDLAKQEMQESDVCRNGAK